MAPNNASQCQGAPLDVGLPCFLAKLMMRMTTILSSVAGTLAALQRGLVDGMLALAVPALEIRCLLWVTATLALAPVVAPAHGMLKLKKWSVMNRNGWLLPLTTRASRSLSTAFKRANQPVALVRAGQQKIAINNIAANRKQERTKSVPAARVRRRRSIVHKDNADQATPLSDACNKSF